MLKPSLLTIIASVAILTIASGIYLNTQNNAETVSNMSNNAILASVWDQPKESYSGNKNITVYRSPSCGCCGIWIEHIKKHGFQVTDIKTDDMEAIKKQHNLPLDLASCHTAIIDGYVMEGHIPADDIKRFLKQKPDFKGLREGNVITINGQINPTFRISQNGLLRLRILNASTSRFYNLSLENHPFYLIATDGGAISTPLEMTQILLTPGQRVELLIKGDQTPKSYRLLNLPYDRGGMGMMGGGMMNRGHNTNNPTVLATIEYDGVREKVSLLTQLTSISSLPNPQKIRHFTLNHGMSPQVGMAFLINNQPYDHQRIDTQVKLGTVEDWELTNTGVMDHPFHLHVNSFQVISRNGKKEPFSAWRDTVLVRRGETVKIRIPFQDYRGKTVYHCHILDHEDLGMMGNLEIV